MGRTRWSSTKSKSVPTPQGPKEISLDDFVCENLLAKPDEETCLFIDSQIESIKRQCYFPNGTIFHPFSVKLRSDYVSRKWICFFEYPFLLGFSYPFSLLVSEFFQKTQLAYAQLMPMAWRVFAFVIKVNRENGLNLGLHEIAYSYDLQLFGSKRYLFRKRSGRSSLMSTTSSSDRGWKNRFFFVDRASIGEGNEISSEWNKGDIDWGELFPPAEDTLTKVEEFFRLSPDKRSPKGLLEASLTVPEDQKASTSVIMSTVSKPVISGSDFDLDEIEAMFTGSTVKIEMKPPPAPKKTPTLDDSAGIGSRVKKRKASQEEVVEVEDSFDGMPVGDFKKKCMSFATGTVGYVEELVKEIEMLKKKSKADIALVRKEKIALENKVKVHEKTLEQQSKSLGEQEQTVKDLLNSLAKSEEDHQKEITDVKSSCKLAAAKTVSQCKIKMMKEYQEGKADTWDINRECAYLFKLTGDVMDEGEVSSSPYEAIVKDAPVDGEVNPNATPAAEAT